MAPHPPTVGAAYGAARSSSRITAERASRHREESAERFINLGKCQFPEDSPRLRASPRASPREYLHGGSVGTGKFESAWWDTLMGEQGLDGASADPATASRPRQNITAEAPSKGHARHESQIPRPAPAASEWSQPVGINEADKRHLLDMELEMRRRRAEAVVGQWAEDTRPNSARLDEELPGARANHRRRNSGSRTMSKGSAERTRRASDPAGEYARGVEEQVADLRRRQAEQAQLLLAQEEQHRQQEEKTMRLLQQQAEELYWQSAQEVEQEAEKQRREEKEDVLRHKSSWQDSTAEEEALGRQEEEQEREYWRDEVSDWWRGAGPEQHGNDEKCQQTRQTEDAWGEQQADIEYEDEAEQRRCQQEEEDEWQRRSAEEHMHQQRTTSTSHVEPEGMADTCGWQQNAKEKENRSWQPDDRHHRSHNKDAAKHRIRAAVHEEWAHTVDEEQLRQQAREEVKKIRRAQQADQQRRQQQQAEEEEQRRKAQQAEESWKQQQAQANSEEFWRQQQAFDQERIRQQIAMEEEHRRLQQAAEDERRWREEEERRAQQQAFEEEERRRQAAELERRRQEDEEERMRQQALDELRRQQARQEDERRQKEEEEERQWRDEEERGRQQARLELRRKARLEEERRRQQAKQEEERRKKEEEEQRWRETLEDARRQQVRQDEDRRWQRVKEEEEQQQRAKGREKEELRQQQTEERMRHEANGHVPWENTMWPPSGSRDPTDECNNDDMPRETAEEQPSEHHGTNLPNHDAASGADKHKETSGTDEQDADPSAGFSNECFYDVLGVARDATEEQIRKAYKRQCMKHHPDKGGDRNCFEDVGRAYQTLSDKALRKVYDSKGKDGVERAKERERKAAEAGAASGQTEKVEKAQPIVVEAHVPLEIAFTGGNVEVQIVRISACGVCQGSGTNPGARCIPCPTCEGQGAVPQYVQLGAMIIEQHAPCTVCAGQGMVLPSTALCPACGGEMLAEEEGRVLFAIPSGVKDKERLVAEGQGHALPGLAPGDVVLVCRMQEHQCFLRKGDDLLAEHHVPLQVALCGGCFEVPHLNGGSLKVRVPRGIVLAPGSVKCVPGEGMPKRHNPSLRGDLVLRFGVVFPEAIAEATALRLESAFEGGVTEEDTSQAKTSAAKELREDEVYLSDFDMEQFGKMLNEAATSAYDEDDEEAQANARAAAQAAQARMRHSRGRTASWQEYGGFGHFASAGSGAQCHQM